MWGSVAETRLGERMSSHDSRGRLRRAVVLRRVVRRVGRDGLGFTAITVALLARTNPLGVIPAALLIGAMQAGASRMQFDSGVSPEIIDVVQALILFFVAADVIIRWLLRIRATDAERVTLSSGWVTSNKSG